MDSVPFAARKRVDVLQSRTVARFDDVAQHVEIRPDVLDPNRGVRCHRGVKGVLRTSGVDQVCVRPVLDGLGAGIGVREVRGDVAYALGRFGWRMAAEAGDGPAGRLADDVDQVLCRDTCGACDEQVSAIIHAICLPLSYFEMS